ncbi:MAG: M20/M25/M40 family metallo-hydrolase [Clostridia bacterium]|nr:M20/M25/M40 family metallo-hydrolase [Clostridia bacterium]
MEFIKDALNRLCSMMTVSGYEKKSKNDISDLASPIFDEISEDSFGNITLVKRSCKANAKRLMIDAHFDTVGMMVTDIHEGGFLSVINIGGLDTRILPSAEVSIYGKERIYGIVSSVPPHLKKDKKSSVPKIEELYIDTGYSKEKLEELVRIGDPVVIEGGYTELLNGFVAAKYLDDKACLCGALDAVRRMDKERLNYDIYVTVSAQEETGKCGASLCAYSIKPDFAIITDVNFGAVDKDNEYETVKCGEGAAVDVSALADRKLTRGVIKYLKEKNVSHQRICEPSYTYTNNDLVSVTGLGIKTLLLSVPLRSMHTPVETLCLKDIKSLADIIIELAYTDLEAL